jgi:hypothetical protein
MPKSKGVMHTFYDKDGESYPFFGRDEQDCINRAVKWARNHSIKLFRVKQGTSPHRRSR